MLWLCCKYLTLRNCDLYLHRVSVGKSLRHLRVRNPLAWIPHKFRKNGEESHPAPAIKARRRNAVAPGRTVPCSRRSIRRSTGHWQTIYLPQIFPWPRLKILTLSRSAKNSARPTLCPRGIEWSLRTSSRPGTPSPTTVQIAQRPRVLRYLYNSFNRVSDLRLNEISIL